jgi:hypothetical protein
MPTGGSDANGNRLTARRLPKRKRDDCETKQKEK